MGGSSSNDGGAGGSTSSSQAGMTGSERTADSEARASRDRPDDNDRGGAREAKETFDRAMDNANRPDRAPPAPADTASKPDDKDEPSETDKPDDWPERAAGPPGIGAPPSSPSPTDTAKETDDNDDQDERSFLDRVADTLTAAPTDAEGNARSTSPVADRINNTKDYSLDDLRNAFTLDPGLTLEQSQALADGAAVMNGSPSLPATMPTTADLALSGMMARAPGEPVPISSTTVALDPIAAERNLDVLGRLSSFDDANQVQVADENSGIFSEAGQAIKNDFDRSIVGAAAKDLGNAIRDDFNRSIIGNALTDTENLSVEFKAYGPIGRASLTLSDKDGEVDVDASANAKGQFGNFTVDPGDKSSFTVGSPNAISQFDNTGSGTFTGKTNNFSATVTGDGDFTINASGAVPVSPLTRVTGGITRTTPANGGPTTVDARAGFNVGVPGVATLGAEVKARDIFGANDPVTTDQPVDTPAPVTGPIDQIAEIEQPDIAQQIAEKKAAEKEQAEAEARARRERSEFGGRAESFADSNGLL